MDTLHSVLRSFNTETKSSRDHLTVFREFLAHLDQIQRKAPAAKSSRQKPAARRKPAKRSRKGWAPPGSVRLNKTRSGKILVFEFQKSVPPPIARPIMHAPLSSVSRLSFSGDGTVEGYASLFGEIDQARDMVMPGAFANTLKARGLRKIPMLFQHDPSEPVGIWLELREDFRGLWARGRLIPDVMRARELLALVEAGAVDGLSIGYRTVRGRIEPQTRVRKLYQVDLWEISIVTFPLLAGARVRAVKQAIPSPLSPARTQAERVWRSRAGAADEPASRLRPRPVVASLRGREGRRDALRAISRGHMAGGR